MSQGPPAHPAWPAKDCRTTGRPTGVPPLGTGLALPAEVAPPASATGLPAPSHQSLCTGNAQWPSFGESAEMNRGPASWAVADCADHWRQDPAHAVLRYDLREMAAQLEAERARSAALENELARSREAQAAERAAWDAERKGLEEELARRARRLTEQEQVNAGLRAGLASAERRLAAAMEAERQARDERERFAEENRRLERKVVGLEAELEGLAKQVMLIEADVERLLGALTSAESQLARMAERLAAAENERDAMQAELSQANQALAGLRGELEAAAAELARSREELAREQARAAALERQVAGLEAELHEAAARLEAANRQLADLQHQLAKAQKANAAPVANTAEAPVETRESTTVEGQWRVWVHQLGLKVMVQSPYCSEPVVLSRMDQESPLRNPHMRGCIERSYESVYS